MPTKPALSKVLRAAPTTQIFNIDLNGQMKAEGYRSLFTLLDITQAFDSIIRPKLWEIIDARVDRKEQEAIAVKERDLTRFDTARVAFSALKVLYH